MTALERFNQAEGHEETDPIERLRFFCSRVMDGRGRIDVEPFFNDVISERDALAAKVAELAGQTDNLLSACHRLALELECLLLDTKDLASVSRWWDSAIAALDEWHKVKDSVSAEQPMNTQLLDLRTISGKRWVKWLISWVFYRANGLVHKRLVHLIPIWLHMSSKTN